MNGKGLKTAISRGPFTAFSVLEKINKIVSTCSGQQQEDDRQDIQGLPTGDSHLLAVMWKRREAAGGRELSWDRGRGGAASAWAGPGHPVHAENSSHMLDDDDEDAAAAAGGQDPWWEQDMQDKEEIRRLCLVFLQNRLHAAWLEMLMICLKIFFLFKWWGSLSSFCKACGWAENRVCCRREASKTRGPDLGTPAVKSFFFKA